MEFDTKEGRCRAACHTPWFRVPDRRTADVTVVFGHWSQLGLMRHPGPLATDTGCVGAGAECGAAGGGPAARRVWQVRCG
jgi:bis(5'-nucleosyl)-tetraphosphatase (symmetrical)